MKNLISSNIHIPDLFFILCSRAQNENRAPDLDGVFFVLANHQRRILFGILCRNERQIEDLVKLTCGNYQAIRKQLAILEAYKLIVSYKDGKNRYYHAAPDSLHALKTWAIIMDSIVEKLN